LTVEAPEAEIMQEVDDAPVFTPPKPKKGRASWAYDDPLAIPAAWKDPKLTYRYVLNEPRQINRRMAQGFVMANKENGAGVGDFKSVAGNNVDRTPNAGGDLVLMAAYKEIAEGYVEHINKQTDSIERAITREVREDAPIDDRTGQRAESRQRLVIE